ncbi:hypothetical protein C3Y89_24255 [Rhizobium sp. UPM1132]|uniref:DUF5071 domain-containing protein n=1 Tax=Rhizobium ruizarguesonis TaxID=2081791 RepID=UPI00144877B2|nr:DUF5071 domain-containing protein [Rhizobium ruizarguesonis]NKQ73418.1 hypothetical protein [Rhizobium ruizarguesonis]
MRLPANKFDLDAVYELEAAGYPAIAPLLDDLVAWTADGNWPVARPIADLLVSTGTAFPCLSPRPPSSSSRSTAPSPHSPFSASSSPSTNTTSPSDARGEDGPLGES